MSAGVCESCGLPYPPYVLRDDVWESLFEKQSEHCLLCAMKAKGRSFELDEFEWVPITVYALVGLGVVTEDEAAERSIKRLGQKITADDVVAVGTMLRRGRELARSFREVES